MSYKGQLMLTRLDATGHKGLLRKSLLEEARKYVQLEQAHRVDQVHLLILDVLKYACQILQLELAAHQHNLAEDERETICSETKIENSTNIKHLLSTNNTCPIKLICSSYFLIFLHIFYSYM